MADLNLLSDRVEFVHPIHMIDCQKIVDGRIAFLPKNRKRAAGDDLIRPSTKGLCKPLGDIAGASAINLTLVFAGSSII